MARVTPVLLVFIGCSAPDTMEHIGRDDALLEEYVGALLRGKDSGDHDREIAGCLEVLRRRSRTGHLCHLVEFGLGVHLRNLEETRLARELPVTRSPALAELARIAGIPRYRTPHEAGWLSHQFYGPFQRSGWSSFQLYLWAKERGIFDDWPNEERILALLKAIDASPACKIGGDGVCHYGCQ